MLRSHLFSQRLSRPAMRLTSQISLPSCRLVLLCPPRPSLHLSSLVNVLLFQDMSFNQAQGASSKKTLKDHGRKTSANGLVGGRVVDPLTAAELSTGSAQKKRTQWRGAVRRGTGRLESLSSASSSEWSHESSREFLAPRGDRRRRCALGTESET